MITIEQVTARAGLWKLDPMERIDRVPLARAMASRPFGRAKSESGVPLTLVLPRGVELTTGDLLCRQAGMALVVDVLYPSAVAIDLPPLPWSDGQTRWVLQLCHFLGNQHLAVRIVSPGLLRIPTDDPDNLVNRLHTTWGDGLSLSVQGGEPDDPLPHSEAHG